MLAWSIVRFLTPLPFAVSRTVVVRSMLPSELGSFARAQIPVDHPKLLRNQSLERPVNWVRSHNSFHLCLFPRLFLASLGLCVNRSPSPAHDGSPQPGRLDWSSGIPVRTCLPPVPPVL